MSLLAKIGGHLKSDWYKYLLEILVVILGILIAYQLDRWNEARKNRDFEVKILKEFKRGLMLDLNDLRDNIRIHRAAIKSCNIILKVLEQNQPYHDSLDHYFAYTHGATVFIENTSPFEILKSNGFDVISNDTFRNWLINIYDRRYEVIHRIEPEVWRVKALLSDYDCSLFEDLIFLSYENWKMKPIDFSRLKTDTRYAGYLRNVRSANHIALDLVYDDIDKSVQKLIVRLDKEIKKIY